MKLTDYTEEVYAIARNNKVSNTSAAELFIINLNVMKNFHHGSGNFNYRAVGQEWGRIPYMERNAQKKELIRAVAASQSTARRTARRVAED